MLKKGTKVNELIQVSYASSEEGIKDREFKGLLMAAEELEYGNMKIITWDYEGDAGVFGAPDRCQVCEWSKIDE